MNSPYRTPAFITSEIQKLCFQLDATESPVYVYVSPDPDCDRGDCYNNVQRKVDACSGRSQHGWNIRVWPNVLLDAQFHAVYVTPEGGLVDLTPNQEESKKILFLPDSVRRYTAEGGRIPSVRVALNDDAEISEYIHLTDEKDRLETAGILPEPEIQRRRALLLGRVLFRYTCRRNPCPCESGKKYKHCCYGLPIEQQLRRFARRKQSGKSQPAI